MKFGDAIELDAIHTYYTDREVPLNAEFIERVPRRRSGLHGAGGVSGKEQAAKGAAKVNSCC